MLCVIDIGNTNIVAAFMTGPDSVVFSARIVTERDKTEEMFEEEILNVFSEAGYETRDIEGTIISSVVPEITDVVKNVMEKIAGDETGKTVEIAGCDNCLLWMELLPFLSMEMKQLPYLIWEQPQPAL